MKLTKKQQKFIKQTHLEVCNDWQAKIEEAFPRLFEIEQFKKGDWIWNDILKIFNRLGDVGGNSVSYANANPHKIRKATTQEIKKHLIQEAKERKIWNVPIIQHNGFRQPHLNKGIYNEIYRPSEDSLFSQAGLVYYKGQWAKPLKTITKKEAEQELDAIIIN